MATKEQINSFIKTLSTFAMNEKNNRQKAGKKWTLPSVCIAQAALETGWGNSPLMVKANAYFGIKAGTNWKGKVYDTKTQECYDGVNHVTITDTFRAYDSLKESVTDYFDIITGLSRYSAACNITDARKCIQAIKDGGYATSPTYVNNVMSIINQYNLTQYDKSTSTVTTPSTILTVDHVIDAMIKVAEAEIGYLEKGTNSQLDDKSANAGNQNYTKYWRDVYPQYQAQAWCACFVSWVFMKTFGLETAKKLLKHWPYVYCPTLGARFTKYSNPQKGDVVIFYRNGEFAHTGIVIKVEGDKFWTIEGNTSGGSTIIANGGGVCKKSYYNSQLPGTKFCRPDYSIVKSINSSNNASSASSPSSNKELIKQAQKELNNFVGTNLAIDGVAGQATKTAFRKAIQKALNKDYKAGLVEDGVIGDKTNAVLKKVSVKKGSKGYTVSVVEIGMLLNGYDPNGVEYPGIFGEGLLSVIKPYQLSKRLDGKGIVAKKTLAKLVE